MNYEKDIADLSVERQLDEDTGEVTTKYQWKGNSVCQVELTGRIADRVTGLSLIAKDLGNALSWMKHAQTLAAASVEPSIGRYHASTDREIGDQVKALFIAALTFYGKAFTQSKGRAAQLSKKSLDDKHHETHETHEILMSFRHNLAVHSGEEGYEHGKSYLLIVADEQ